jgi:hypothetical protein
LQADLHFIGAMQLLREFHVEEPPETSLHCMADQLCSTVATDEAREQKRSESMRQYLLPLVFLGATAWQLAQAQALDPTLLSSTPPLGLGGLSCKQIDDTGRLHIFSDGPLPLEVLLYLQKSDFGTKADIPLPLVLERFLPGMPPCIPGMHHAALQSASRKAARPS